MLDERKNIQTTPTRSTVGPCPTHIKISKTPRHWKFTQHHRITRPPPTRIYYPCSRLEPVHRQDIEMVGWLVVLGLTAL